MIKEHGQSRWRRYGDLPVWVRLWRRVEAVTMWAYYLAWWLKGLRRCPACRLTWELPVDMDIQGGVCHDCMEW